MNFGNAKKNYRPQWMIIILATIPDPIAVIKYCVAMMVVKSLSESIQIPISISSWRSLADYRGPHL
jgi:hypothetical protein